MSQILSSDSKLFNVEQFGRIIIARALCWPLLEPKCINVASVLTTQTKTQTKTLETIR